MLLEHEIACYLKLHRDEMKRRSDTSESEPMSIPASRKEAVPAEGHAAQTSASKEM
jgi:hypothetical protein